VLAITAFFSVPPAPWRRRARTRRSSSSWDARPGSTGARRCGTPNPSRPGLGALQDRADWGPV